MAAAKRKILLIGWDAADWKIISPLMDSGEMPNLERFVNEGTMGNLTTFQPMLTPLIWNSIATGVLPDKHGIIGFSQVDPITGTVRPFSTVDRKVKAIWNILSQSGFRTNVVNWFASHPAEPINGVYISELFSHSVAECSANTLPPLPRQSVHPAKLSDVLAEFRVTADEIDCDQIALFVRKLGEVDQTKDPHLATLARLLAECFTTHAATTWTLENTEWDFTAAYYPAIDHFSHAFMQFHPPQQRHVSAREFDLYSDVIKSVYRLHDLLLGRLLQLAGDDATIILCSDHGYHSDHLRPRYTQHTATAAAAEHRPIGILAMKGPGIKRDELVHAASVMDIAPTILHLYGLPIGEDMPGKPLLEALDEPAPVARIRTWETSGGNAGLLEDRLHVDAADYGSLLKHFVALGYMPEHSGDDADYAQTTLLENKWNLARVYADSGKLLQALPLLEEIYEEAPLRLEFALHLADCLFRLGLKPEAGEVIENLIAIHPKRAFTGLYRGMLEYERGDVESALAHLAALEERPPATATFFNYLGLCYLRLSRAEQAQSAFARALLLDSHNSAALIGQTRCSLHLGNNEAAVETALRALGSNFALTQGHYYLGIALARLGELERSAQAFETCLRITPRHTAAHRCLIRVCHAIPARRDRASELREAYSKHSSARLAPQMHLEKLRREMRERTQARHQARAARDAALLEQATRFAPRQSYIPPVSKTFVIVSGLPRSGTSLMMQMLQAGGLPAMTDGKRVADEDNPEGYLEWEEIKELVRQPSSIEKAEGKAIKVISMLLPHLPSGHKYKVLFMDRPVEQIAASQAKMLARRNVPAPERDLAAKLRRHRDDILNLLQRSPEVEHCIIDYPSLVQHPEQQIQRISSFLGETLPMPQLMKERVRRDLFRNQNSIPEFPPGSP